MSRGLLTAAALLIAAPLAAQRTAPAFRPSAVNVSLPMTPLNSDSGGRSGLRVIRIPLWTAPVASAIVPGVGQAELKQQRFVAYLAVEGFVWLQYFKDRRDWRQQRASYRALAAQGAGLPFTPNPPVGGWDYYERMEHYLESGVYSQSGATGPVVPESDESTYNGAMWLLARRNFWPDPGIAPPTNSAEYQNALNFYEGRAVQPAYRWSWRNAQLEQDLYRTTINKANDAVRRTTSDLGIVLANHVLSSVDAFASLQLHLSGSASGDYQLGWTVVVP